MSTVLITGGTGLIGRALTKALTAKNYQVIILTRDPGKKMAPYPGARYAQWPAPGRSIEKEVLGSADFIIHLAGAGVAEGRWTRKRKKEIVESRIQGGRVLTESLRSIPNKVRAVISSTAIGWYGPDPVVPNPMPFVESDPAFHDFLGSTCKAWEESLDPLSKSGTRLVKLRTGIVLSETGGALKEFQKPIRFGITTILGSGRQMVSWIHIDDLVSIYITAMENEKMTGVYNAVAPTPVTNRELMLQLARSMRRFFLTVRIPALFLKLVFGELSIEVLKSATVSSRKIMNAGYSFRYPTITEAFPGKSRRQGNDSTPGEERGE